jgi:hypothetical protein
MKRLLYLSVIFFLAASTFSSCEKVTTKGISTMRYYPVITMAGDASVTIDQGAAYTDAGATAEQNGVTLDVVTSVTSLYFGYSGTTVDSNVPDVYFINYTATNDEGFSATASRTVTVNLTQKGDFVTSLDGYYTSDVLRVPGPSYSGMESILVVNLGGNTYGISDGIGGYYAIGRNYGDGYLATPATFTADIAGNVFTPGPSFGVGAFGGVATMSNIAIDPVAKTITFTTTWDAGYTFNVTLTQHN